MARRLRSLHPVPTLSSTTIDHTPGPDVRDFPSEIADTWRRLSVIDIGSNSVRLVVFEGLVRAPLPIFNERVLCGIGRDLAKTNLLHEGGVELALSTLERFVTISGEICAGLPDAVATAAVREAHNGADFVRRIRERCGLEVRVLSGTEEARLSALGAMSAIPDADGVMGDLGGGSLELVVLNAGEIGESVTLPLGALRLMGLSPQKQIEAIDHAIEGVPWLKDLKHRTFYAVGGAWRSLARIHMAQRDYPLRIVHQYQLSRSETNTLVGVISGLSPDSMSRIEGVNKRRLESLPGAAAVLSRLLRRVRPGKVMFLAGGLREGLLQENLPNHIRDEDPLISQCRAFAIRESRFGDVGDELARWMAPLFKGESELHGRLRLAACLVSDVAWRAHPSYRAAQAFEEVFRAPVVGVDHEGRAFMAIAINARYNGTADEPETALASTLIDSSDAERAKLVGVCLRLGLTLSGGAAGLLSRTRLGRDDETVTLRMRREDAHLYIELIERRLASVARCLGLVPKFAYLDV